MDEESEIPPGELFRLTVWNEDGVILTYEKYAASIDFAIREHKETTKLLMVEQIDPLSKNVLDSYYYE